METTQKTIVIGKYHAANFLTQDIVLMVNGREIIVKLGEMRGLKNLERGDIVQARGMLRIKGDALFLAAKSAKILQRVGSGEPQIECEIIDDTPPICKFCGAKLRARLEKMEGVCRACNGDFVDEAILRACGRGWRKKRFVNF